MDACTKTRDDAQHTWPELKKMPECAVSTATSMSASAHTMSGLLPPSSSVTRFSVPAASRWMMRPTSVEPVKAIFSTSGCATSAAPAVGP